MFIILGLGNPASEYEDTRHNLGYRLIDELISRHEVLKKDILKDNRVQSYWAQIRIEEEDLVLAKSFKYMNESGISAKNLLGQFDVLPEQLIIAHDDMDLSLEQIRIKLGSSSGGHLGVDSVIDKLGTQNFIRLRLGIGRPPARKDATDFVLEEFKKTEIEPVQFTIAKGADAIADLLTIGLDATMNKYNSAPSG